MNKTFTLTEIFNQIYSRYPNRLCLQEKRDSELKSWTYAQLQEQALKVSSYLVKEGLKKGDFCALILENRPEWPAIYFGIIFSGLICVPLDPQLSLREIDNLITDSDCKVLFICQKIFKEKDIQRLKEHIKRIVVLDLEIEDENIISFSKVLSTQIQNIALPEILGSDIASLIYTSGTTGKPKGVLLTQENLCANLFSLQKLNLVWESDNFLSLLPLHHTYAFMVTLLVPILSGAKVTYCSSLKSEELLRIIKEAGITILVGVPQLFSLLHKALYEKIRKLPFGLRQFLLPFIRIKIRNSFGKNLRYMVSGGARLDPIIGKDLLDLGLRLLEGYGLTEASPVVTLNPLQRVKYGSVGKPIPDVLVNIHNPDKKGIGQILVKGKNVMQGYFRQPELSTKILKEGWLYTKDLGYFDKGGYLYLIGREEELLVLSSGKNVSPEELEAYYCQSPYIKEICIVLQEEKIFGYVKDSLYAVITPDLEYFKQRQELNIYEKIRWELENLGKKLPPYQHVMGFILTKDGLPRTALRKLKRWEIREKYLKERQLEIKPEAEILTDEERALIKSEAARKIIEYVSGEINKPVSLNSHLEIDLGIDSLSRVELGLGLESLFKIKIQDQMLYSITTIKDTILAVQELISKQCLIKESESVQKSWGDLLKKEPPKQILAKIKLDFGLLENVATWIVKQLFLFFFRLIWFLRVEGRKNLPNKGPYLICTNHASFLDGLFIFNSLPFGLTMQTYFLGYQHIFEHPALYWANKICRFISVDVNSHLTEAMQAVSFVILKQKIVCIFPEGQRSIDENIKEFKNGVGILMKELDIPVVPAYIKGSHWSWPRGTKLPRPYPIKVIFGKPLHFGELKKIGLNKGAKDDYQACVFGLRQEVIGLKENKLHLQNYSGE